MKIPHFGISGSQVLRLVQSAALVSALALAAGCASTHQKAAPVRTAPLNALRVAVAGEYIPLIFEQDGFYSGAEADLARALGKELNRPVDFVRCKRTDLLQALQDGRADIVMSGMSVTDARQLRAAFCEPYLKSQLRAVFRRGDAERYKTPEDIRETTSRVGVLPGTTADTFVQKNCPYATRMPLQSRRDIVFWLTEGGKIDIYVDDLFALAQIVSQSESTLAYLQLPLQEEDMAWAVAPANTELLTKVNEVLAKWKTDGTLDNILQRWMPYLKKKAAAPEASKPDGSKPETSKPAGPTQP